MSHPEDIYSSRELSINDVAGVMDAVGLSPAFQASMTEGLHHALIRRREQYGRDEAFALGIDRFVLLYERAMSDNADGSNLEGWFESLEDSSQEVLVSFEGRSNLDDTQQLARESAAFTYIFLNFQINRRIDPTLLERSGLDTTHVLGILKVTSTRTLIGLGVPESAAPETTDRLFRSLDGRRLPFPHDDIFWPRFGTILLTDRASRLRVALESAGRNLPGLKNGRFGKRDELPI